MRGEHDGALAKTAPATPPHLVVPCYNEAARLDVAAMVGFVDETPGARLLFVDDGSSDGTWRVLGELEAARPEQIQRLKLPSNAGKAEAVRTGMLAAFATGSPYVGYWDADLATPLEDAPMFAQLLDANPGADLVMGSRVKLLGRPIHRNAARHYIGRVFATAASVALDLTVYDTQCGAKLFRRSPRVVALFEAPFRTRWVFDVELLARLRASSRHEGQQAHAGVIIEAPVSRWVDVHGSKVRWLDGIRAGVDLAWIAARYR